MARARRSELRCTCGLLDQKTFHNLSGGTQDQNSAFQTPYSTYILALEVTEHPKK